MSNDSGYVLIPNFEMLVEIDVTFEKPLNDYSDSNGIGSFLDRWSTFAVSMQLIVPRAIEDPLRENAKFRKFVNKSTVLNEFIKHGWRDMLIPHETDHGLQFVDLHHIINRGDPEFMHKNPLNFFDLDEGKLALWRQFSQTKICPAELQKCTYVRTRAPVLILEMPPPKEGREKVEKQTTNVKAEPY